MGRASTTARGYGYHHQQERRRWARIVEAGVATCARCGWPIFPGEPWHLDHASGKRGYLGASHARCNLVHGAKRGAALTNARRRRRRRRAGTSRVW
jgi:hypothetical protein